MSLDMYLHKKVYVGANYKYNQVEGTIDITKEGDKLPINFDKVVYIEEVLMYWSKADSIHRWFVDNVQDGADDCLTHEVSLDKLKALLNRVTKVLKNRRLASTLLPVIPQYHLTKETKALYWKDLAETKRVLEEVINDPNTERFGMEFNYLGSW